MKQKVKHEGKSRKTGGGPYQPHPGTCTHCYRCSLPGLAEFTATHCGGTGKVRHNNRQELKESVLNAVAFSINRQMNARGKVNFLAANVGMVKPLRAGLDILPTRMLYKHPGQPEPLPAKPSSVGIYIRLRCQVLHSLFMLLLLRMGLQPLPFLFLHSSLIR